MYDKNKLLKNHTKMMKIGRPLISERYGESFAEKLVADCDREFEQLIPQLPDIGGKQNDLTDTLVQTASALALYRVMKREGKTAVEAGNLIRDITQAWIDSYPEFMRRHIIGRLYMSGYW